MIKTKTPSRRTSTTKRAVNLVIGGFFLVASALPAFAGGGIRDAEIERVLRSYGDPIYTAAGLDPKAIKMYIINDPSMNAFVAGGQNVFINTGMIMELDTPNELKGVIAHETGHISGGHLARGPEAMAKTEVPMIITMLAGVAAIAAGAPDLGMGLIIGAQSVAQRQILSFSRAQESSADQAGVKFLNATGQSPAGMVSVFNRFADQEALSGARQDPFVRSHPLSRERVAALEQMVDNSPYRTKTDSQKDLDDYALMRAKLRGFIESPDVTLRRYPLTDQSAPAHYARAVAYFKGSDLQSALNEVDMLIKARPTYAYFWELKGQILVESSKPKEGVIPYRKAVELAPDEPLLQASLGAAIVATEDETLNAEAKGHLQRALQEEPDNGMAWYNLAAVYDREGNEGMAALCTAEQSFAVQNYGRAVEFSKRALNKLKEGTQEWQRANDIQAIAGAAAPRGRG